MAERFNPFVWIRKQGPPVYWKDKKCRYGGKCRKTRCDHYHYEGEHQPGLRFPCVFAIMGMHCPANDCTGIHDEYGIEKTENIWKKKLHHSFRESIGEDLRDRFLEGQLIIPDQTLVLMDVAGMYLPRYYREYLHGPVKSIRDQMDPRDRRDYVAPRKRVYTDTSMSETYNPHEEEPGEIVPMYLPMLAKRHADEFLRSIQYDPLQPF